MGWFTAVTLSERNGNDRPPDDEGCALSHLLVGGSMGMNKTAQWNLRVDMSAQSEQSRQDNKHPLNLCLHLYYSK